MSDNFGNDTYVAGGTRTNRNVIYGSKFELSYNGRVVPESIFVYSETGGTNNWRCAIYSEELELVAITEQRLIGWGNWYEFAITTPDVKLTGPGDFHLVSWSDNIGGGGYNATVWDTGVNDGISQAITFGTFPSTLAPSVHNRKVSIYCTYQPVVKKRPVKSA